MMNINPKNEIIATKLLKIYRDVYALELPYYDMSLDDHGDCKYKLTYVEENQSFLFSFYSKSFDEVFKVDGENLLKTKYKDFKVIKPPEGGFNLTLSLDCSSVPKLTSGVKGQEKENILKAEEEFFGKYSEQLALFKRNLYASPYEKVFSKAAASGVQVSDKIEFAPSEHEAVWIIPQNEQIMVYVAINFDDTTEKALAKLILLEMEESKRHVQNSPSIQKVHKGIPEILTKEFPTSKNLKKEYSNGLICISLLKRHYSENLETCATMLSQFRIYLKYHIQASKTYLHGRIRRRVGQLQKTNNQAKFEEEGKKVYRSAKGKNKEVILNEKDTLTSGSILHKK